MSPPAINLTITDIHINTHTTTPISNAIDSATIERMMEHDNER